MALPAPTRWLLSEHAAQDLREIAKHSQRQWGDTRTTAYMHAIRGRIDWALTHAGLWQERSDLRAGFWSLASGKHLLFFTVSKDQLVVLRILHKRMDYRRHLPQEQP